MPERSIILILLALLFVVILVFSGLFGGKGQRARITPGPGTGGDPFASLNEHSEYIDAEGFTHHDGPEN